MKDPKKLNLKTFTPILPPRKEVPSSQFKRKSKAVNFPLHTMMDIEPKIPKQLLTKKSTINLSEFKRNSFEEPISKNIEIGTAILKNIPLSEAISAREKIDRIQHIKTPLSDAYKNRSGDVIPLNPLVISTVEPSFKSPQLSPTMEQRLNDQKKKTSFRGNLPILGIKNMNLYASLSLNPLRSGEEEIHSALGQSIPRIGRQIKEVDEAFEKEGSKLHLSSIDRSVMEIRSSESAEEEIKEQELLPDEVDFKERSEMLSSWDFNNREKNVIYGSGDTNEKLTKKVDENDAMNTLNVGNLFSFWWKRGDEAVETFYEDLFITYKSENYLMLAMIAAVYLYEFGWEYWKNNLDFSEFNFLGRMFFGISYVLVVNYFEKLFEKQQLKKAIFVVFFIFNVTILWPQITQSREFELIDLAKLILVKLLFQNISIIHFVDSIILNLTLLGILLVFRCATLHQFSMLFFFMVVNLYTIREKFLREVSKHNLAIANVLKKSQQKNLVRNLLPNHITQQFINKPSSKSDLIEEFKDVTVLFADIKGFTDFSAHNPAPVVVNMLRDLFTEFDKLCLQNDVYKLYTIGDCYVALGLVDANERNFEEEARNVLQFAFGMINAIKSVRKKNPELEMRIGLHIVFLFHFLFDSLF